MGVSKPRLLLDQRVTMRDGVELSADVYLPSAGDGPWPTLLARTPYDNSREEWLGDQEFYAANGYAYAFQDVRGRGDSDGRFRLLMNEARDGHDTIVWVGEQPWCNGKVGMIGGSYGGVVQWLAAKEHPPHLMCMASRVAPGRWMEEIPYCYGLFTPYYVWYMHVTGGRTFQASSIADWERIMYHRPMREADIAFGRTNTEWRKWLATDVFDDEWREIYLADHFKTLDLPVLHITGWFDGESRGQFFYWRGMTGDSPAADRQWLVVGPWTHAGTGKSQRTVGGVDFGPDALLDMRALHLAFFDRWLKGIDNGFDQRPRAHVFAMGQNAWQDDGQFPPKGTVTKPFYFHSYGRANTLAGDGLLSMEPPAGEETADTFVYDPDDPTPTWEDLADFPVIRTPSGAEPPLDNRWRLRRDDVLVYTSAPLEQDLEITGYPFVVLYASSDCPDTDWHVTLCDVTPQGKSIELVQGQIRAAYRGVDMKPQGIVPGEIREYRIELMAVSNVFLKGHRLRVTVASCDFPRWARNPNTNARYGDDDVWQVATNSVHHSGAHPSHLLAPVVPRGVGP
jgi:putative CocE/NonD family hydrolase